jgi:hypothetical protein
VRKGKHFGYQKKIVRKLPAFHGKISTAQFLYVSVLSIDIRYPTWLERL